MVLLVARCLAVYGATAAATLLLVRRFVSPLSLRVALVLAAAPLLFTGRALLTGSVYGPIDILYNGYPFGAHRVELGVSPDRTPVLSDVVYQQIPWRAAVRRAAFEGRMPLWNPDVLGGEPLLAVQQPAVLHPGTWIGLLLPLPQAWTFEMTLRLLIALVCAYLFLRDLWCCELASLLGALGWAFSNWMIFSLGVPLMPAAAPFPLLLLGLRRIAREPGRRSVALTVAALVLIGVAGHPETLLHACAAAGVYFLFELARSGSDPRRGSDPRSWLRPLTLALGAGALALGLLAVQLLPLAEALPHTLEHPLRKFWYSSQPRSVSAGESLSRLTPQVMPYAVGVSGQGRLMEGFIEPSAYGGALLFPLAFAGLFARCRERWIFVTLGLLGLAVAVKTPVADALAKLPLFDIALNERLVFLTVFSLCVLAALGAHRLRDGEGAPAFFAGAGATLLLLGVLFARAKPRVLALGMPPAYLTERFLFQVAPLVLATAALAFLSRRRRATAGLAALVLILAASRRLEVGRTHPVMPLSTFYPPMSVLAKIPRGEPWRIAGVGERAMIPNASAVYGLEDVRGYAAMTLLRFSDTFPLWCEAQPIWFNRIDDPTRPFLSFLNVRWVLTEPSVAPPPGWPVLAEADGLRLVENPAALPRVFVPRTVRVERDPARRRELLKSIDDFAERGIVESDGPLGEWLENGSARLEIAAYSADTLDVDVEASAETLVATSLTAWPGWKARLDGTALPALPYNHAFLAFRVPPGRHRLSLRYFPDGVARGLAASGATLLLCGFLLFRPARRELRQNPV